MQIRFGEYELDEHRYVLERSGQRIKLRPKVFDLLVYLVANRRRVVRREELVEALWEKTAVGEGSLSGLVNELRAALGEGAQGSRSIRTVHARGYQFVATVEGDTPPDDDEVPLSSGFGGGACLGEDQVAAVLERVTEQGACGVVVDTNEIASGPAPARDRDAGALHPRLAALVALAQQMGFEVFRIYSPDASMASSSRFAREIIDRLIEARGRDSVLPALPLPARMWFEEIEHSSGSAGRSRGPADPLGTIVSLLSRLSRRRPIVMLVEDVERSGLRLARELVAMCRRLARDPVLWVATTQDLANGGGWLRVLEGEGGFDRLLPPPSSIPSAVLDRALRRLGLDPLPAQLVEAIETHVEADAQALERIADWVVALGRADSAAAEEVALGHTDEIKPAGAPISSPMRRVTPSSIVSRRRSHES